MMKSMFSRMLALSLVCIGTTFAGQATFHLPFDAHWGKTALPAGDYQVTLPEPGKVTKMFYLNGQGISVCKIAGAWSGSDAGGESYLKVVELNGEFYIQDYVSGGTGTSYMFVLPKIAHRMQISERKIPVAIQGTK